MADSFGGTPRTARLTSFSAEDGTSTLDLKVPAALPKFSESLGDVGEVDVEGEHPVVVIDG